MMRSRCHHLRKEKRNTASRRQRPCPLLNLPRRSLPRAARPGAKGAWMATRLGRLLPETAARGNSQRRSTSPLRRPLPWMAARGTSQTKAALPLRRPLPTGISPRHRSRSVGRFELTTLTAPPPARSSSRTRGSLALSVAVRPAAHFAATSMPAPLLSRKSTASGHPLSLAHMRGVSRDFFSTSARYLAPGACRRPPTRDRSFSASTASSSGNAEAASAPHTRRSTRSRCC